MINQINFFFNHNIFIDPPTIDILTSVRNNDPNEDNGEDIITNKECLNQNNVILNSEIHQKQQPQNDLSETLLKTSSRPQRQAAKKAENQIRVNTYTTNIILIKRMLHPHLLYLSYKCVI